MVYVWSNFSWHWSSVHPHHQSNKVIKVKTIKKNNSNSFKLSFDPHSRLGLNFVWLFHLFILLVNILIPPFCSGENRIALKCKEPKEHMGKFAQNILFILILNVSRVQPRPNVSSQQAQCLQNRAAGSVTFQLKCWVSSLVYFHFREWKACLLYKIRAFK